MKVTYLHAPRRVRRCGRAGGTVVEAKPDNLTAGKSQPLQLEHANSALGQLTMVTSLNEREFLTKTHYFFDFYCGALVTDVLDCLMFAEGTIDEKFRSDVQALQAKDLSPDLYDHCLENIKARFEIGLPTTTRYSALLSLTTGVAWCAEFLTTHLKQPQKLSAARCGLKRLQYLNDKTFLGRDTTLKNYSNLVIVRDSIVHNAGILRITSRAKSPDPLPDAVCALPGFSIRDDLFV